MATNPAPETRGALEADLARQEEETAQFGNSIFDDSDSDGGGGAAGAPPPAPAPPAPSAVSAPAPPPAPPVSATPASAPAPPPAPCPAAGTPSTGAGVDADALPYLCFHSGCGRRFKSKQARSGHMRSHRDKSKLAYSSGTPTTGGPRPRCPCGRNDVASNGSNGWRSVCNPCYVEEARRRATVRGGVPKPRGVCPCGQPQASNGKGGWRGECNKCYTANAPARRAAREAARAAPGGKGKGKGRVREKKAQPAAIAAPPKEQAMVAAPSWGPYPTMPWGSAGAGADAAANARVAALAPVRKRKATDAGFEEPGLDEAKKQQQQQDYDGLDYAMI